MEIICRNKNDAIFIKYDTPPGKADKWLNANQLRSAPSADKTWKCFAYYFLKYYSIQNVVRLVLQEKSCFHFVSIQNELYSSDKKFCPVF